MSESKNNLLLVGVTGFLGGRLYEALEDRYNVSGISRSASCRGCYRVDFTREEDLDSIDVDSFDTLVFAASEIVRDNEENIKTNFDINVRGLINVLEFARRNGVKHVVYCSSASVYGRLWREVIAEDSLRLPDSYYGISRYTAEEILREYCEKYGIIRTVLRFSSIYGPGQIRKWVIPNFIEQALLNGKITVYGKGERTQDFLYIEDAVRAVILAIEKKAGITCNVGGGASVSMKELAELVNEIFIDSKGQIIYNEKSSEGDNRYVYDISYARQALGFEPGFNIRNGLLMMKERLISDSKI